MSTPARSSSRWLPNPGISVVLLFVWLMLVGDPSARMILLGALWAVGIPWIAGILLPVPVQVRSWTALLAFLPRFLWDVVVANLVVALLVLSFHKRPHPAWLVIPLDVEHPYAITMLASVISLTPGTVSAELSADRRTLLVHALNVADPEAEVARIKRLYEAPIKEIFG